MILQKQIKGVTGCGTEGKDPESSAEDWLAGSAVKDKGDPEN